MVRRAEPRPLSKLAVLLVAGALAAAAPAVARAEVGEASRVEAEARHQRGLELFQAGDFAAAAREFEAAELLAPAPANLFNLARCREQLGDLGGAIATLERFLAVDELSADHAARGQAELERLRGAQSAAAPEPPPTTAPDPPPPGTDGGPQGGGSEGAEPTQEGAEVTEPTRRIALTIAGQLDVGLALDLEEGVEAGALLGLEVALGLRFGRLFRGPRQEHRMWRFEGVLGLNGELGLSAPAFEVTGAGRLSLALGRIPVRLEGEAGLGLILFLGNGATPDLMALVGATVVVQLRSWVELALRVARVEFVGLVSQGFSMRYGADAQVRFRY